MDMTLKQWAEHNGLTAEQFESALAATLFGLADARLDAAPPGTSCWYYEAVSTDRVFRMEITRTARTTAH